MQSLSLEVALPFNSFSVATNHNIDPLLDSAPAALSILSQLLHGEVGTGVAGAGSPAFNSFSVATSKASRQRKRRSRRPPFNSFSVATGNGTQSRGRNEIYFQFFLSCYEVVRDDAGSRSTR